MFGLFLLGAVGSGHGATLTWGPGGAGGNGTWNAGVTANWWDGSGQTTWTNLDIANFGGTPGIVTVDGTVTIAQGNALFVQADGYVFAGTGSINSSGSNSSWVADGGTWTTINTPLGGSANYYLARNAASNGMPWYLLGGTVDAQNLRINGGAVARLEPTFAFGATGNFILGYAATGYLAVAEPMTLGTGFALGQDMSFAGSQDMTLSGARAFTTAAQALVNRGTGVVTFSGDWTGTTGGLTLSANSTGVVAMTGNNSWTGLTTISGTEGALRATAGAGLPATSGVLFSATRAVLETSGTFNRTLTAGTPVGGEVKWTSSGGFAAHGGALTVDLNTLGTRDALAWGGGGFVVTNLVLNSASATHKTELVDHIDLNSGTGTVTRIIHVNDNPAVLTDYAELSGNLTKSGAGVTGLTKTGPGLLVLSGENNVSGILTIGQAAVLGSPTLGGGTLRLANANAWQGDQRIYLHEGTLDLNGNTVTTRELRIGGGAGGSQAVLDTGAGSLVLTTNVDAGNIVYYPVFTTGSLGSPGAPSSTSYLPQGAVIRGTIDLGAANRTVFVNDNPAADEDVTIAARVIGGAGVGLTKDYTGTLVLGNADNAYTGATIVTRGTLRIATPGALPSNLLTVAGGGTLDLGDTDFVTTSGANAITLGGGAADVARIVGTGTLTLAGNIRHTDTGVDTGSEIAVAVLDLDGATRTFEVTSGGSKVPTVMKISAQVTGAAGIVKTNNGVLWLANDANDYTGTTTIQTASGWGGVRVNAAASSLPAGNLALQGGVLESSGTFTRSLGTGENEVRWVAGASGGGFSAYGGKLTVTLAGAPAPLVWNSTPNFATTGPLIFGTLASDREVEFTPAIDLNGAARVVNVYGSILNPGGFATLSGAITGTGSSALTKGGAGTLVLTGANSWSGATTVNAGALRAAWGAGLPVTSNLVLGGGAWEGSGTFTPTLGTGAQQLRWNSGGFAAQGGKLVVTVNDGAALTWAGTGSFATGNLIFGSTTADREVEFTNNIDLGTGPRTVQVIGTNPGAFATLSGQITGNQNLSKTGEGTLVLSNPNNTYTGITYASGGFLEISSQGNVGGSSGIVLGTAGVGLRLAGDTAWTLTTPVRINLHGVVVDVTNPAGVTLNRDPLSNSNVVFTSSTGDGVLILGNAIAKTQGTALGSATVPGPTLKLSSSEQTLLNSGGFNILSGAFDLNGFDYTMNPAAVTMGGGPAGSTSAIITGDKTLTIRGDITYNGHLTHDKGATLSGTIDLGTANRSFIVYDSANAPVDFDIQAKITGARSLSIGQFTTVSIAAPPGVIRLANTANDYTLGTYLYGGILRTTPNTASLPAVGVFQFSGRGGDSTPAVLETSGSFTRALGSTSGLVQFSGPGGFSAYGGALDVNFGGAGANVDWTGTNGLGNQTVQLGSPVADNVVTIQNPIGLSTVGSRKLFVFDNPATTADHAVVAGALSDGIIPHGSLIKDGPGTLVLTGANSFTGDMTIADGTLALSGSGSLAKARGIMLASASAVLDVTGVGGIVLAPTQVLAGTGTVRGTVTVAAGSVLSPGLSPGTLVTDSMVWAPGGGYLWEINDAGPAAVDGVNSDLIVSASGLLTITASDLDPFLVDVRSLTADNVSGAAPNWDQNASQSWLIADFGGGIAGFSADRFEIVTTAFLNPVSAEAAWSVSRSGGALYLNYTLPSIDGPAVPEPTSLMLLALAGLALLRRNPRHA